MVDAPAPLTPEQRAELERANEAASRILRAARVAAVNGWTVGIFAALSLLFGFRSPAVGSL